MRTPQELRRERIAADYRQMQNIRGRIIDWRPVAGEPPLVTAYALVVRVRTIVGPGPSHAGEHYLNIDLPDGYPFREAPRITMTKRPYPFHPNWYDRGRWCFGHWMPTELLGDHVIRMVRTLQFDPELTSLDSVANRSAVDLYRQQLRQGQLPVDRQRLPDPACPGHPSGGRRSSFVILART